MLFKHITELNNDQLLKLQSYNSFKTNIYFKSIIRYCLNDQNLINIDNKKVENILNNCSWRLICI